MTKKLKKLSIKGVTGLGTKELKDVANSKNPNIVAFTGEAHGHGSVSTQYGDSKFITGIIFAQNMQTSEVFQAGKAFLPSDFTDELIARLDSRKDTLDTVEFGVQISVAPSTKGGYGYEYITEAIKTPDVIEKEAKYTQKFLALSDNRKAV
jgi:hypothetical protein